MRLPPEILSRIFWYATAPNSLNPEDFDDTNPYDLISGPTLSDKYTYFQLCAVCARWRHIAHSSPDIQLSLSKHLEHEIPTDKFPWSRVGHLRLNELSLEYACRLLILCRNVVKVICIYREDLGGYGSPALAIPEAVIMASVQSLSWVALRSFESDYDSDEHATAIKQLQHDFFARFRFPAVRQLKWNVPLPDASTVRGFFQAMSQVEELHFFPLAARYCVDQYLDLFQRITKLVMEVVDDENGGLELLQRITIKRSGVGNLFPQLQELYLRIGEDIDPDGLIVVLYSRRYSPVDWSDPAENPSQVTLLPYDATSPHWQSYARLTTFSVMAVDEDLAELNWTYGDHYPVVESMCYEAKRVTEFERLWSESLLVF